LCDNETIRTVVVDFRHTHSLGATALELLARLFVRTRDRCGALVLCNISPREHEIVALTGLTDLCLICSSREEALAAAS
jgi:anti-anti-sigma factor